MTRVAGIIGRPVGHSLSPVFQAAAFASAGLDVSYEKWETEPSALADRIRWLREPHVLGANVTIPYKEDVSGLLDRIDPQAASVGAINTITNVGGRLTGYNTDGEGFVESLRDGASFEPSGRSFLLLGAGGAARGIAFGLAAAGVESIAIANRTPSRSSALAADVQAVAPMPQVRAVPMAEPLGGFDCIVNCTSLGMSGTAEASISPRDLHGANPDSLIVDIVYTPALTPFLRAAREAGLATLGGLPMLVHQGGLAFSLWTGTEAPIDVMLKSAKKALGERATLGASEGGRR